MDRHIEILRNMGEEIVKDALRQYPNMIHEDEYLQITFRFDGSYDIYVVSKPCDVMTTRTVNHNDTWDHTVSYSKIYEKCKKEINMLKKVTYQISKEDYERAEINGAYSIIGDDIKMGYGAYNATVYESDGNYYLSYDSGTSCD